MKGIHHDFQLQVLGRLHISEKDHDMDLPYPMDEVYKAAIYILGGQTFYGVTHQTPGVTIKTEPSEVQASIQQMSAQLVSGFSAMTQALTTALQANNRPQLPPYNSNRAPNPYANRAPPQRQNPQGPTQSQLCSFCSDPNHFMRTCPLAREYERDGKCVRNADGRLTLPNGSYIPRTIEGRNFAERFDRWHELNPGQVINGANFVREAPPHAKTMWWTAEPLASSFYKGASIEEVTDEEDTNYVLVNEGRTTRSRKEPEKPKPAPKRRPAPRPEPEIEQVLPPPPKVTETPEKAADGKKQQPSGPQYRFVTPIEMPSNVKTVLDRTLDAPITLSHRELLSLSMDLRRQYKDLVSAKKEKVVVANVETNSDNEDKEITKILRFVATDDQEELQTASKIEQLRVIYPKIEGHKVECVLDQGSEITAMNHKVWRKLGVDMEPGQRIGMESANGTKNSTLGLIEDLRITIGGMDLFLQVQVVQNAPFDMLIGRPFFKLTESTTKDYTDGSQDLTITCPNSGRTVTIPTMPKYKKGETAEVGFLPVGHRA